MSSSDQPVVSVVIPCFNQGRFLADAIDSVLGQTHRSEAIVVDDGSTDNTLAVVKNYAGVVLIQQRNQGAAVARTSGLRQSRADFVVFLDADDRLLPDAVATGLEYLSMHGDWAFVTGHARLIDIDGSVIGTPPQDHGYWQQLRRAPSGESRLGARSGDVPPLGLGDDRGLQHLGERIGRLRTEHPDRAQLRVRLSPSGGSRISAARREHEHRHWLHAAIRRDGTAIRASICTRGFNGRTGVARRNGLRPVGFRPPPGAPGEE